jgi:hypothetical protein
MKIKTRLNPKGYITIVKTTILNNLSKYQSGHDLPTNGLMFIPLHLLNLRGYVLQPKVGGVFGLRKIGLEFRVVGLGLVVKSNHGLQAHGEIVKIFDLDKKTQYHY